uniref:Uncharacterized protein n=1 Tax=Salix viminalis TaxID=40686 RepID=A0A6N2N0G8_SALVM
MPSYEILAHYLLAAQLFRILATASAFGLNCIVTSKPVMELIGDGVYASKKQAQKLLDHGNTICRRKPAHILACFVSCRSCCSF